MTWDTWRTGQKMSRTLHIYFSSPPQSVPLPSVGDRAVELLENLCPSAWGAGTARCGTSSQKWEWKAVQASQFPSPL